MGSWNETCLLSNLPIVAGDRVVWMPLIQDGLESVPEHESYGAFHPFFFSIRGVYNDYGSLEEIDDTPQAKSALRYFKDLVTQGRLKYKSDSEKEKNIDSVESLVENVGRGYFYTIGLDFNQSIESNKDDVEEDFQTRHVKRVIRYVMMHENLYDSIIEDLKNRQSSYYCKTKFGSAVLKDVKALPEQIKKEVERQKKRYCSAILSPTFMHIENCFYTRLDNNSSDMLNVWFTRQLAKKECPAWVIESSSETYIFLESLRLMRITLYPKCGKGSQGRETTLHNIVGKFAKDYRLKDYNEYTMENVTDKDFDEEEAGREGICYL